MCCCPQNKPGFPVGLENCITLDELEEDQCDDNGKLRGLDGAWMVRGNQVEPKSDVNPVFIAGDAAEKLEVRNIVFFL